MAKPFAALILVLALCATPALGATCGFYQFNSASCSVTLGVGDTLAVSTCAAQMPGAGGSGDTTLRIRNPQGIDVASNDDYFGCGFLSYVTYTAPTAGTYTVTALCVGSCSGAVAYTVTTASGNGNGSGAGNTGFQISITPQDMPGAAAPVAGFVIGILFLIIFLSVIYYYQSRDERQQKEAAKVQAQQLAEATKKAADANAVQQALAGAQQAQAQPLSPNMIVVQQQPSPQPMPVQPMPMQPMPVPVQGQPMPMGMQPMPPQGQPMPMQPQPMQGQPMPMQSQPMPMQPMGQPMMAGGQPMQPMGQPMAMPSQPMGQPMAVPQPMGQRPPQSSAPRVPIQPPPGLALPPGAILYNTGEVCDAQGRLLGNVPGIHA